MANPEAIIADDEEQLRIHLKSKLADLWPELTICGEAANGLEALELIESCRPAIAFLDIKMPGLTGIEVARKISADCRVVFITAFDQFAVEAFENEAVDYILKPVSDKRLGKTVQRLKNQLSDISDPPTDLSALHQLKCGAVKEPPGYVGIGNRATFLRIQRGRPRAVATDLDAPRCDLDAFGSIAGIALRCKEPHQERVDRARLDLTPQATWTRKIHKALHLYVAQCNHGARDRARQ